MHAHREREEHESLFRLGRWRRIDHCLGRAIVVVDLDQITGLQAQVRHIRRVHVDIAQWPAVHNKIVLLVQIGGLPDVIRPTVIDKEGELVLFRLLSRRLKTTPLRRHEDRLAVLAVELAVGEQPLRSHDLAVGEGHRGLLEAVGPHGDQPLVGDELPTAGMLMVAIHEGVFLGLPVIAFELVGDVVLAGGAPGPLQGLGQPGDDQTIGHRLAGRIHVALGQPHAPLTIHRRQVHLARSCRRQDDMRRLADLRGHDVDVDAEKATLPDCAHDGVDLCLPVAIGNAGHGVLHHIGALLVGRLELERVQCGLVMVASPDVMDATLATDQELIDIRRRPSTGIVGPDVAFLVAAHANAATAWPADIPGGERQIDQRSVGPIVVVAPDQAFLVSEHGPASLAVLGLGYEARRLLDLIDGEAGELCGVFQAGLIGSHHVIEAACRSRDEFLVGPSLRDDIGHKRIEERQVGSRIYGEMQDIVLAGFDLAGIDGHGAPGIDDDDPGRGMGLTRELLLLLVERRASQVRNPVVEEVVGLGFERIRADREDGVG